MSPNKTPNDYQDEQIDEMKQNIKAITENHLPHIYEAVVKLTDRVSLILWVFGVLIIAYIGQWITK